MPCMVSRSGPPPSRLHLCRHDAGVSVQQYSWAPRDRDYPCQIEVLRPWKALRGTAAWAARVPGEQALS